MSGDFGISKETWEAYRRQGWGAERIGFGERPALLVVDMQDDFINPSSPSTCAPMAQERLPAVQRLLAGCRDAHLPIFFSQTLVSPTLVDRGLWKGWKHRASGSQIEGTPGAEIVPELAPLPGEYVIQKRRPSAFFESDIDVFLRGLRIDTLIMCGTSMSGCVRASVVDAFSKDYRVAVVAECVIDRSLEVLHNNLFDVGAKYADVISLDEALEYVSGLQPASPTASDDI